ncbi:hypothetical protein FHS19_003322 [Paenibacillus rhizosphaerae]|uniref:Uncharacterized protein n=1 Tax=Paenibacillus rhizosphaerae TaxID=297318 RepID=A0A839TTE0_9BACL|nr:hypothetical protein [Paenibacillus rhizosphaerae]MBB3128668.1 hypothetical protein [Paenibacillus rhizosphaerae]
MKRFVKAIPIILGPVLQYTYFPENVSLSFWTKSSFAVSILQDDRHVLVEAERTLVVGYFGLRLSKEPDDVFGQRCGCGADPEKVFDVLPSVDNSQVFPS